jgi:hypothetical protein
MEQEPKQIVLAPQHCLYYRQIYLHHQVLSINFLSKIHKGDIITLKIPDPSKFETYMLARHCLSCPSSSPRKKNILVKVTIYQSLRYIIIVILDMVNKLSCRNFGCMVSFEMLKLLGIPYEVIATL